MAAKQRQRWWRGPTIVLLLTMAGLLATPTVAQAAMPTCDGAVVTIDMNLNGGNGFGTGQRDVILGTSGPDTINGLGGDDIVCSQGGDDVVFAGAGDDRVFGGTGHDTIYGATGRDYLHGGYGNDTIIGQGGFDTIFGFGGNDTIKGMAANDFIYGGRGKDKLFGNAGVDKIWGGHDLDQIWGGNGGDFIYGEETRDILRGGGGPDWIEGGDGHDDLYGDANNDVLRGDAGADTCTGGGGSDVASSCESPSNIELAVTITNPADGATIWANSYDYARMQPYRSVAFQVDVSASAGLTFTWTSDEPGPLVIESTTTGPTSHQAVIRVYADCSASHVTYTVTAEAASGLIGQDFVSVFPTTLC